MLSIFASKMARGGNLLFPLILALIVGLLLYFYWGASSQAHSLRTDNHAMKKELSNARNERDNVQYRLNLLKEDLEVALQRKEEAERREKEEHQSAEQAKGQLKTSQEQLDTVDREKRELKKQINDLEEQKEKVQEQANDYSKRLSTCESSNAQLQLKVDLQASDRLRQQNMELQLNIKQLGQDKTTLVQSLNEATEREHSLEQRLRICEEAGGGGGRIHQVPSQSWAQPAGANDIQQHNRPQMHSQMEAEQLGLGAGAYQAQPGMNAYQAQHPAGMVAGEYQAAGNKDRPDAPDLLENKIANVPLRQVFEREP